MAFADLLLIADRANLAVNGQPVAYAPAIGAPVTVNGIFENAYQRIELGNPGVTSTGPMVFVRLSDLPTDLEQDTPILTINGQRYTVKEVQRDGQGGAKLMLFEAT